MHPALFAIRILYTVYTVFFFYIWQISNSIIKIIIISFQIGKISIILNNSPSKTSILIFYM